MIYLSDVEETQPADLPEEAVVKRLRLKPYVESSYPFQFFTSFKPEQMLEKIVQTLQG